MVTPTRKWCWGLGVQMSHEEIQLLDNIIRMKFRMDPATYFEIIQCLLIAESEGKLLTQDYKWN